MIEKGLFPKADHKRGAAAPRFNLLHAFCIAAMQQYTLRRARLLAQTQN